MISISNLKLSYFFGFYCCATVSDSSAISYIILCPITRSHITDLAHVLGATLFFEIPHIFMLLYGNFSTSWAVCLEVFLPWRLSNLVWQLFSPSQIKHFGRYMRSLLVRPEFVAKSRGLIWCFIMTLWLPKGWCFVLTLIAKSLSNWRYRGRRGTLVLTHKVKINAQTSRSWLHPRVCPPVHHGRWVCMIIMYCVQMFHAKAQRSSVWLSVDATGGASSTGY